MKKNLDYYRAIIDSFGVEIQSTEGAYEILRKVNTEFGLAVSSLSADLKDFCTLLGSTIVIVEDRDAKVGRGKRKPKLYQIIDSEKAIDTMIRRYGYKRQIVRNNVPASNIDKAATEGSGMSKRRIAYQRAITDLYKCLSGLYDRKKLSSRFEGYSKKVLEKWLRELGNNLVNHRYTEKSGELRFTDLNSIKLSMLALDSLYKENFYGDLGAGKKFGVKKIGGSAPKLFPARTKEEVDSIMYATVKLLYKEGSRLNILSILKVLREHFGITLTKAEYLEIIQPMEFVIISQDKSEINLSKSDKALENIKEFQPENYKFSVFARISMSLEELNEFVTAKLVSKISEHDGIYELELDKSFNSMEKLMRLVRTFRGTDTFIGSEELYHNVLLQIARADGIYKNSSFMYQLEKVDA